MKVSNKAVAEALGGLPPAKLHCSNLAADALHEAIEDYRRSSRVSGAEATRHCLGPWRAIPGTGRKCGGFHPHAISA
jgi:hypothetical protein